MNFGLLIEPDNDNTALKLVDDDFVSFSSSAGKHQTVHEKTSCSKGFTEAGGNVV